MYYYSSDSEDGSDNFFALDFSNAENNYAETNYIETYYCNEKTIYNDSIISLSDDEVAILYYDLANINFDKEYAIRAQISDLNEKIKIINQVQLRNLELWVLSYLITFKFTSGHNGGGGVINLQHCFLVYHEFIYEWSIRSRVHRLRQMTIIFDFLEFV